jgi:ATP-binding cassette, subfamily C, bacterial LapB
MSDSPLRQTLLTTGQYIAREHGQRRWPWQKPATTPIIGARIVDVLVAVAARAGQRTEAAALTAGLPRVGDDLDFRLAPIALARLGLQGGWDKRPLASLASGGLPAVLLLKDDRALLLLAAKAKGQWQIWDGQAERVVDSASLGHVYAGEAMAVGTADPVNGAEVADEREAIRTAPRRWIIGQFLQNKRLLVQLAVAAAFLNLCALTIPLYLRAIYDRVVPNLAIETLWALSLGVLIVLLFELAFKGVRSTFIDAIGLRMGQLVQHKVMASLLGARMSAAPTSSGMVSTAMRDIESMTILLPSALVTFFVDLPFFLVFAALIWMIGGPVVAAAFLGAVALVLVGLVANLGLKRASARANQLAQARANLTVDIVEGLPTLKAAQAQGRFLRAWDVIADHSGITARKARDWSDLPVSVAGMIMQAVTVGVVIIGVFQLQAGALTVGGLVACTLLAGRAMVPISSAIQILSRAHQSLSQFVGLTSLLALEPERDQSDESLRAKALQGEIALKDVTFAYPGDSRPALQGLNVSIRPGEKVAVIGRSGSGKSTLMQLVAGLYQTGQGAVLIDGHNANQYAASQLRRGIAYAAQDAALFDMSVRENILLGFDEVTPDGFERALKVAGVDVFTQKHPEGLGLKAGARGGKLSGGQRQSIVLARALVRNPAVLLLDEPTAAMDIATEQAVIRGLKATLGDTTLILSTHRMALLQLVDRVLWLEDGRLVADKPRDDVLAMFKAQAAMGHAA